MATEEASPPTSKRRKVHHAPLSHPHHFTFVHAVILLVVESGGHLPDMPKCHETDLHHPLVGA